MFNKVNNKEIDEMLEVIKVIGLEDYLDLTNKFYEKFKKRIENLKGFYEISYNKEEFFFLLKYILKKKIKNDSDFLRELKENIKNNKENKDFSNLNNFIEMYSEANLNEIYFEKSEEENKILYQFNKNKRI